MKQNLTVILAERIVFVLCLIISLNMAGQVAYTARFDKKSFVFENLKAIDSNEYITIKVKDLTTSDKVGKPMLPVRYVRLYVPPGGVLNI